MIMKVLSLVLVAFGLVLLSDMANGGFVESYTAWSQDILPDYVIKKTNVTGRKCYCKLPGPNVTTPPPPPPPASSCGDSENVTIIVTPEDHGQSVRHTYIWESPNYPNGYEDGCTLSLYIELTSTGSASYQFEDPSKIYSPGTICVYDNLAVYFQDTGVQVETLQNRYCDTISMLGGNIEKYSANDKAYLHFIFEADPGDGNTVDIGFRMVLKYLLF